MKKSLAVMIMAALVASAFVAPAAEAKKKKKKPPVCAAYVPGERGAAAETVVVTDAATAEAPAIYAFSLGQDFDEGLQGDTSTVVNVQVDSAAASAGLYATFEFPMRRDYDMYAYHASGNEAASSHGFNPIIEADITIPVPLLGDTNPANTTTNHAGESKADSENIVGLTTNDCGGYTFRMANYFGEGGDFELKLWLGEGTTDPRPDEAPAA